MSDDRLWVGLELSAAEGRAAIEGDRVITVAQEDLTTDPAAANDIPSLVLAYSLGVGLMRYQPAPDGTAEIIPELAAGPPEVSDDLRRYTFTIRPGFRFSPPSGEPVTAETVRYSLERAIAEEGFCNYLLGGDVVGAADFQEGKADHVAGISVEGETVSIELTAPSATLPARLASPCASVVPVGTPVSEGQAGAAAADRVGRAVLRRHPCRGRAARRPPEPELRRRSVLRSSTESCSPWQATPSARRCSSSRVAPISRQTSGKSRARRSRSTAGSSGSSGKEDCPSSTGEQPCFVRPPSNIIRFVQLDTRQRLARRS